MGIGCGDEANPLDDHGRRRRGRCPRGRDRVRRSHRLGGGASARRPNAQPVLACPRPRRPARRHHGTRVERPLRQNLGRCRRPFRQARAVRVRCSAPGSCRGVPREMGVAAAPSGASAVESDAARRVVILTDAVLRGYRLPPSDRVHAIRLIGSTISGFLNLERVGSFDHSAPPSEVSWRKVLDAVDLALRAWPAHD